jgi:hypothetical protein
MRHRLAISVLKRSVRLYTIPILTQNDFSCVVTMLSTIGLEVAQLLIAMLFTIDLEVALHDNWLKAWNYDDDKRQLERWRMVRG